MTGLAVMTLLTVAVFVGSLFQSVVGFGSMLVAAPVLFIVLEPRQAVLCALVLGLVLNILVVRRDWKRPTRDVLWAVASSVPTMALGVVVVTRVPGTALLAAAGAVSLALGLHRLTAAPPASRTPPARGSSIAAGAASGLLNTTVGMNGPPLAYWLARSHPADFRCYFALVSSAQSVLGIALLAPSLTTHDVATGARLAPALLGAVLAAFAISRFITLREGHHQRVVALTIVATGLVAIAKALAG